MSVYPDYKKIPEKYKTIMNNNKPKSEMPIWIDAFVFKEIDFFQIMGITQIIIVLVIYLLNSWGQLEGTIENIVKFPVIFLVNALILTIVFSYLFRKFLYNKYK